MKFSYLTFFFLILLPILIFFHTRGVVTHDEGYILQSSLKMVNGNLPYRDFHFVYTPLTLFATATTFLMFTPSILSSRILMIAVSLITCLLIYKIVMLPTRNRMYATFATLLFVAWGPTHINFAWPVMFAVLTANLTCYLLLKFLETRKDRYLFFAGIAAFAVFLAKQNFGIAILAPILIFFTIKNARHLRYVITFLEGYAWGFILFCIYLLKTDSFAPFVNDFYSFTIQRILIDNRLTTHFIYQDSLVNMSLRTLFYLFPLLLSVICCILLFIRRRFHLIFLPVYLIAFYIVGIRPTTDYIHLVPLMSLIGMPIGLYLRYNISSTVRILLLMFSLGLIIGGFQTALFKGYYRWDSPLIYDYRFFANKRVNVLLNGKFYDEFNDFIQVTNKFTRPNDYILVNSYDPMIYFITQRQEPTKNNFLTNDISPKSYYDEVLGNLIGKKIKLLVIGRNSLSSLPIKQYIVANYHFEKTIQDFDVFILNP